jgi:cytochrome c oxidase cbb3-type subunit 3
MDSKMLKSFFKTLSFNYLLLFSIIFTGCAIESKKTVPAEYQVGQTTFHKVCAQCHGADAMGGKGAPTFLQEKFDSKNFPNGRMVRVILNGSDSGAMPAQKRKVNDEQIREIIKYIRHLQREAGVIS